MSCLHYVNSLSNCVLLLPAQAPSDAHIGLLRENAVAVKISMNGKGRALDNIITVHF